MVVSLQTAAHYSEVGIDGLLAELSAVRSAHAGLRDRCDYLALDNLLLARRADEAERLLAEERRCAATSGPIGSLLGWAPPVPADEDIVAALQARAEENVKLQHALFEQHRTHSRAHSVESLQRYACVRTLQRALAEAEAEAAALRSAMAALTSGRERERTAQRADLDGLRAICVELQQRCTAALDEVESNAELITRLRDRDREYRRWRTRLRRASTTAA